MREVEKENLWKFMGITHNKTKKNVELFHETMFVHFYWHASWHRIRCTPRKSRTRFSQFISFLTHPASKSSLQPPLYIYRAIFILWLILSCFFSPKWQHWMLIIQVPRPFTLDDEWRLWNEERFFFQFGPCNSCLRSLFGTWLIKTL